VNFEGSPRAGRHAAGTWSAADDSQIIAITVRRGSGPWFCGPLDKLDATTGETVARVIDWGCYPDWR
jgi:hypothetical protein